jgi:hypothetical protein
VKSQPIEIIKTAKNLVKLDLSFELETGNYSLPKIPTDTLVY